MQPLKPFKNTKQLSESEARVLMQKGGQLLPLFVSDVRSLSDLLDAIPKICNEEGLAKIEGLFMRGAGVERFTFIPIEFWVNSRFPHKECKSDKDVEQQLNAYKDAMNDLIRMLIRKESPDEYIQCGRARCTDADTGELKRAIVLLHSDSPTLERLILMPYTDTEADGYAFEEAVWDDNPTGRFCRLREKRC
jgi:hypothetical protein